MCGFRIGELSKITGIPTATIRYYERIGLLPSPPRTPSGYRSYPATSLQRLKEILRIKEFGFSLNEVVELLALPERHGHPCREMLGRVSNKLKELDRRIHELQATKEKLADLIRFCDASAHKCQLLETLSPLCIAAEVAATNQNE